MADDHTLRSYRSNDPYRHAAEPARPTEPASTSDPLAELARLIGQSDPFAEFGRSNSRQKQQEAADAPATAPDDWQYAAAREPQFAADDPPSREAHGSNPDYAQPPAPAAESRRSDSRFYNELHVAADQQGQQYDDGRAGDGQHDGQEADHYYDYDDVPLEPHEDEMYDDAPRARHRGGLATALALIGCALLGTAGAYAYRSYYGDPSSTQPPPVITADSSTPTKIVPATAGDPQPGKVVQDRVTNAGKEQLVSKQEEPVALKESGTQAAPRVVLPPPVAPGQGGSVAQQPSAGSAPAGSSEPKKVRTVTIRPDGTDLSGRPVGGLAAAAQAPAGTAPTAAARPTTTAPAPRAGTAARNGPISLDPQTSEPAGRARTAAAPSTRTAPEATESASGGFVVQLSSQKSEGEAQASFRSLQAKFPNELGGRQPIIRRADLGSKGVFYRTMVGPFASAQEASQFCASYKAAGGQCVVPNN